MARPLPSCMRPDGCWARSAASLHACSLHECSQSERLPGCPPPLIGCLPLGCSRGAVVSAHKQLSCGAAAAPLGASCAGPAATPATGHTRSSSADSGSSQASLARLSSGPDSVDAEERLRQSLARLDGELAEVASGHAQHGTAAAAQDQHAAAAAAAGEQAAAAMGVSMQGGGAGAAITQPALPARTLQPCDGLPAPMWSKQPTAEQHLAPALAGNRGCQLPAVQQADAAVTHTAGGQQRLAEQQPLRWHLQRRRSLGTALDCAAGGAPLLGASAVAAEVQTAIMAVPPCHINAANAARPPAAAAPCSAASQCSLPPLTTNRQTLLPPLREHQAWRQGGEARAAGPPKLRTAARAVARPAALQPLHQHMGEAAASAAPWGPQQHTAWPAWQQPAGAQPAWGQWPQWQQGWQQYGQWRAAQAPQAAQWVGMYPEHALPYGWQQQQQQQQHETQQQGTVRPLGQPLAY